MPFSVVSTGMYDGFSLKHNQRIDIRSIKQFTPSVSNIYSINVRYARNFVPTFKLAHRRQHTCGVLTNVYRVTDNYKIQLR
jgi:hypothetical protein